MSLTIDEIEEIDETMELILTIVNDETQWKERTAQILRSENYHSDIQPMLLNIEGKLRVRISDVLREMTDEAYQSAESNFEENRHPAFDPHELD